MFFVIGPALVTRLTPAGAAAIAALAGMLRWTVMAQTTDVMALALVQPLHGITFALLHLACMRLIARTVPHGLEGQPRRSTVPSGLEQRPHCSFLSPVCSTRAWARKGFGSWLRCARLLSVDLEAEATRVGGSGGINSEDITVEMNASSVG